MPPNSGGLQTTITNASGEPVRLEFRAIGAPTRHGGFLTSDPNTGFYNPSTVIEFPEGNVTSLVAEVDNPWDILKVCLAPLVTSGISCADATSYVILSQL